jgi:seryl-tRNA synthetase
MIDIKLLLKNPERVAENNKKRGKDIDVHVVISLHEKRIAAIEEIQSLRTRSNEIAAQIPSVSEPQRKVLVEEGKAIKEQVKEKEAGLSSIEENLNTQLTHYPNILRDDVPVGKDESSNETVEVVGKPTAFSFEPKDHLELAEALDLIDMQRAAKISGARFAFLKGDLVLMQFALLQYALTQLVKEGFIPILPPHIISTEAMGAMGYLQHGGEEEIYHLRNDDAVLIGTSEQSIGPMHMDEILDGAQFPIRYVGYSPCYRREAGSYGKDTHGIFRVHQFSKVEMFSFTSPEHSDEEHEFLLKMQRNLWDGLKLPYRVVKLSSGDTGTPSARTYDIETWFPSYNDYRETHSTSNTTDYQTRRLKTRYKTSDGKTEFAHALNGTAFSMNRPLIAILENYQQEDGSIVVPEVLRTWMGKDRIDKFS